MASKFREIEMTAPTHFENGPAPMDMAVFLRDLVHELANPLNSLSMNVEILQTLIQRNSEPRAGDAIERLRQDQLRLEHLLRSLRTYATALAQPSRATIDLHELIEEAQAATHDEEAPAVAVVVTNEESRLSIARTAGVCAIAAILRNAAEAGASQVTVAVESAAGKTRLIFDDDGPGIDDRAQARVLDAFFTSQRDDAHFGLGLTAVRAVARAHGGDIEIRKSPNGGARIVFAIRDSAESSLA